MNLKDKVAFITGAGSGIGKATAVLLSDKGVKVALVSRTRSEIKKAEDEIKSKGGEALAIKADISSAEEVKNAIDATVKEFGRLDFVFANAGINGVWAPLEDLSPEDWNKTININLTGTFYTVKYAVPELKKQGGAIVVTSSVNGTRIFSNTGTTPYACSKAAQVAFTKMTALELAKHKVRINVICPGAVETEIEDNTQKMNIEKEKEPVEFPEGKIPLTNGNPAKANQVAKLVLFLLSDDADHITGTEMWIDGAESLIKG